jgi:frataxin-like iron-binding protein CyaY
VCLSLVLLCSGVSAVSIDDETGDVEYCEWVDGTLESIREVNDKPNLDITEISYVISGGMITMSLQVLGTIEDNEDVSYDLQIISEEARYHFYYQNGEEICWGESYLTDEMSSENVTISGGTISCTFEWYGETSAPTGQVDIQATAMYSIKENYEEVALYGDALILSEGAEEDVEEVEEEGQIEESVDEQLDDGTTDVGGSGTPGFEVLVLLGAVCVLVLLLRRNRRL